MDTPERKRDLVIANRILAMEGVLDAYGHISVRHPEDSGRYCLARSLAPELVTADHIMEFTLYGAPVGGGKRTKPEFAANRAPRHDFSRIDTWR